MSIAAVSQMWLIKSPESELVLHGCHAQRMWKVQAATHIVIHNVLKQLGIPDINEEWH